MLHAPTESRRILLYAAVIMGVLKKIEPHLFADGRRLYELTATPLSDIGAPMGVPRYAVQLVAEANFGGDMVRAVIRGVDPATPVKTVHATRGKWLRAEPVASLYAQGRVKHVGALPALEDEMADFGLSGASAGHSPDRLDALVYAVTELTAKPLREPRIRQWWSDPLVPGWARGGG